MSGTSRRCTILGGPRDGEIVAFCGSRLRMPVPTRFRYALGPDADVIPPTETVIDVDEYALHRDDDGRYWYVREPR